MKLVEASVEPVIVHLVLSRRNLEALLTKLDWPESERTILKDFPVNEHIVSGLPVNDGWTRIVVSSEEDDDHYVDEPPGAMHPVTETMIRERK